MHQRETNLHRETNNVIRHVCTYQLLLSCAHDIFPAHGKYYGEYLGQLHNPGGLALSDTCDPSLDRLMNKLAYMYMYMYAFVQ